MPPRIKSMRRYIVDNSKVDPVSGCWIWQLFCVPTGYGQLRSGRAHRYSYVAFKGAIPEGLEIRHLCHNRPCVNPKHLDVGTHKQNMQDMVAANRGPDRRGEKSPNSVLKEADVLLIRKLLAEGEKIIEVARQFDVAWSTIGHIKTRKTWSHV